MKRMRSPPGRFLCIAVMMILLPTAGWAADPLPPPAPATLNVTVDGTSMTVKAYNVVYVANPIPVVSATPPSPTYDYQSMNIYVPSNATESSPIILQDNNGGWNGGRAGTSVTNGTAYSTASTNTTNQKTAAALKAGYVIANVGCRSRVPGFNKDEAGNVVAHAPAQAVDVKAAIRYLRFYDSALPGTTNRIIITGTSGGGALGVAVAASGNSPDYYPYLYALGAAGVTYDAPSGAYSSTLNDDIFGTVLYCPITDLDHMDAAYEWMYGQTRREVGTYTIGGVPYTYSTAQFDASDWLAANYATYFDGLGLRNEKGRGLTASHFLDAIKAAAERGVEKAYRELGAAQLAADINNSTYPDGTWYSINAQGKANVDLDQYLYFVAKNTQLKGMPASDNLASPLPKPDGTRSESTLAGTPAQEYSNFAEWSWKNNALPGDGVGYDDTGLEWAEFIQTDAGEAVVKQMVMSNPMPYLVSGDGDAAPYWYFRHGMKDRDTSFDVPVALYYAVLNSPYVSNVNFNLAWLKPHGGDYDVPEAYEWVAEAVDNAKYFDAVDALIGNTVTQGFSLPTGDQYNKITYSSSNKSVFNVVDGQAVVTPLPNKDAAVSLTVRVVSDRIFANGYYNYGKVDVSRSFMFTVPAKSR